MANTVEMSRAMLKLSGEIFGDEKSNISPRKYDEVARTLINIRDETNIELAVVIGGGNIYRGRQANSAVDRVQADYMGMLATIINGVGLTESLVRFGAEDVRLISAVDVPQMAEPYIFKKARHHLKNGRMAIIVGGLGKPFFSTDSAVAQYAAELDCDMVFKASTVDGVYDKDPRKNGDAKKFTEVSYRVALNERLGVMDQTAFSMLEISGIPLFVFNIKNLSRLPEIIRGDHSFGTLISR